jgi:adenylate cyclase
MRLKLTSTDGVLTFELKSGVSLVLGRAPTSDLPVFDPTISRRHAEVRADGERVALTDLGSSNGTFINGTRIESGIAGLSDLLAFGKVAFKIEPISDTAEPLPRIATPTNGLPVPATPPAGATPPRSSGGTIVKQFPVRIHHSALTPIRGSVVIPEDEEAARDKDKVKLATLLEVSKGLGRAVDTDMILESIAGYAYQILDVDRVAILLMDEHGELAPKISRDKRGTVTARAVPQSIARKVVDDQVAVLTDDAGEDQRFGGQSILMQRVRSAMCTPLIGSEGRVLGVLYVDNVTTTHRYSDEDLDFLIAFSGIAAVAIENSQFAERIRRETLARSNFERYFAPNLAARIASSPEATRLGGEKRTVTVLFSDIRGFTALAETMRPDDMATLLTEYFTEMVECVFRNGGTLDKFIGDAVMAQWGAPLESPDDPDRAMRAAIEMIEALDRLNDGWRAAGRPELQIGVGLNFGEAFAGNIGSERRLEFTVIGDTVNTARRLCESAAEREILISDELRRALSSPPPLIELPPMELKGKSVLVPIYKVVL